MGHVSILVKSIWTPPESKRIRKPAEDYVVPSVNFKAYSAHFNTTQRLAPLTLELLSSQTHSINLNLQEPQAL